MEQEAKERSRSSQKVVHQIAEENAFSTYHEEHGPTAFTGYHALKGTSKVNALWKDGVAVSELHEGDEGMILLSQTPFYAEMGGQVGDTGTIVNGLNHFRVENTTAPFKGIIAHQGKVTYGTLKVDDAVTAEVDAERRQLIANHHTATHLLHWALHEVLGSTSNKQDLSWNQEGSDLTSATTNR